MKYRPRELFVPFHRRSHRWSIIVAHRRAGKTVAVVSDMVEKATYNNRPSPRYAYIAPFLKQGKDIAWQYLKDLSAPYQPRINESNLFVELQALPNLPRITIYGADNPDSFRGLYLDGCALDEFGNIRGSIFQEIILPSLIDRRGWAVFMGTPNGPNHFRDMWYDRKDDPEWFTSLLPVSLTKLIPKEELDMMKKMMDPEQYAQEMECSFEASVRGAIYARQMEEMQQEGRISNEWRAQHGIPVNIVADLGWRDLTTLGFFQERPDGIVVDHSYGDNLKPISHYIQYIKDYFRRTGFRMGKIYLPHDARAKSLQTGKSTVEQFIHAGFRPLIVPELSLMDGISAVREAFSGWYYNESHNKELILAMKSYQRKYDEERKIYTDEPVHDWSSHWADMQRYMAIVSNKRLPANRPRESIVTPGQQAVNYPFSLDDIWDLRPQRSARL